MSLDNLTDEELAARTLALMEECPGGVCALEWYPSLDTLNKVEAIKQDILSVRHSVYSDLSKL